MATFINFFVKNKGHIFRIFLFLIALNIIVLILPSERKFRYEFQKNKPWSHDNLIAPFDFPIYKSSDKLKKEIDSINNEFKPYFNYNDQVLKEQIEFINSNYIEYYNQYIQMDSIRRVSDAEYKKMNKPIRINYDKHLKFIIEKLEFIYNKGILDPTTIIEDIDRTEFSIVINRDKSPNTYNYNQVFTQKTAYQYLIKELEINIPELEKEIFIFFKKMNLSMFIEPNLIYDKNMTDDLLNSALESISDTKGFVQTGEKIIIKGELVDNQKYLVLFSLKKEYEKSISDKLSYSLVIGGNVLIILIALLFLVLYIYNYKPKILISTRKSFFILLLITIFVVIASLVIKYNLTNVYIIPFALLPIIIKVFFDERLALFIHLITVFIVGFFAPNGFEFVLLQFISGFAAIFSLSTLSRRGQLYISSAGVFIALSLLYFGIAMTQEADFENIKWIYFLYFGVNALLLLFAYPLIYAFERIFGFISDVTLLELSNTNHPILQKLAKKAPGTFQHSLQVANLAESAASKIKANPLLVRAGALYHDIGKTVSPIFFIENQVSDINPHDKLEFDQSAKIIINHVSEGVKIAKKGKLPQQIIDFIRTHHGVSVVQYFYKSYIKKYPEKSIDTKKFTYSGPRPFSKETALVMMADSIEAAARSIKNIDKQKINDVVEKIIDYQIQEKMFINADITFKEISFVKSLFKKMLINIYHARIEYPK